MTPTPPKDADDTPENNRAGGLWYRRWHKAEMELVYLRKAIEMEGIAAFSHGREAIEKACLRNRGEGA